MLLVELKKPVHEFKVGSMDLHEFLFIQINKGYYIPYWMIPDFRFNRKKYFSDKDMIKVIRNHIMFYKKSKINNKITSVKVLPGKYPDDFVRDIISLLIFGFRKKDIMKIMSASKESEKTISLTVDIINSSIIKFLNYTKNITFTSEYEWLDYLMNGLEEEVVNRSNKLINYISLKENNPYVKILSLIFDFFKIGVFKGFKIPVDSTVKPMTLHFDNTKIASSFTMQKFYDKRLITNVVEYYLLKNSTYEVDMLKLIPKSGDFKIVKIAKNGECKKGSKKDLIRLVNESNAYLDNIKYYDSSRGDYYFLNIAKTTSKHMITEDERIYSTSFIDYNDKIIFYEYYLDSDEVNCVTFKGKPFKAGKLSGVLIEGVLKYPAVFNY